jgi:hypothetical protein
MAKEVQMSIKMERDLREAFLAAAASEHRPAAQIIRELMRDFLSRTRRHEPNAETIAAMQELENGGGTHFSSVEEMSRECGV